MARPISIYNYWCRFKFYRYTQSNPVTARKQPNSKYELNKPQREYIELLNIQYIEHFIQLNL